MFLISNLQHRKKSLQPLAVLLALALLLPLGALTAFGENLPGDGFAALRQKEPVPAFGSITGTVAEIRPMQSLPNAYYILLEDEESPTWFTITADTFLFSDEAPEPGDTVTGFYDLNAPMILIYPPQYPIVALAVNPGDTHLFVGEFGSDLVDATETLMLVITEDTRVETPDGQPFAEPLTGHTLAVEYSTSTRSIPAQTRPQRVVVLSAELNDADVTEDENDENEATDEIDGEDEHENEPAKPEENGNASSRPITHEPDWMPALDGMDLVVENTILPDAPAAWATDNRVVMVPLKTIAEALGYRVHWLAETRTITLSDSYSLTIGADAYVDMSQDSPIRLGTPPALREGRTFVPLTFFRDVIPMNNAYVFENQIVIDNQEIMH
ncbi:copper amine oxidase N-terminal domain-containing protein [Anoxynatronum buryatiense]|uniref:Copper amine oxidase N-terminal domain-containing protein n=1 Tax=Anoxynatronum buryatiense TaxID=489973 RepID=A0AA45WVU5_9CLOT|nr:stalk domain-containing protein [Anoxynatronum buryatiense]SMP55427.1 Copper amine oxidase N-terminal domain-containing protein [Anoxynatronum buryatiense]